MQYFAKENEVTFQNRKGIMQEIKPDYKWSVIDEDTYIICHIPNFVSNQKEKAELIARLLTQELG